MIFQRWEKTLYFTGVYVINACISPQMSVLSTNPYGGQVNGGVSQFVLRDSNGNPKNVSNLTTYMDIFIGAKKSKDESKSHEITKQDLMVINVNVTENMSAIYIWAVPEHNNTQLVMLCRKYLKPTLHNYDFRETIPKFSTPRNVSKTNNSSVSNSSQTESDSSDKSRFLMFIDNDDLNQTAAGPWYCGFHYNGSIEADDQENSPEKATFNITIVQLACKYLNETSKEWQYDGCKVRSTIESQILIV